MSAARDAALAVLGMKHDPARGWWMGLSEADRVAVLVKVGAADLAGPVDWDALPGLVQSEARAVYEKARRQYFRLRAQFERRGAAGVA